MFKSTLMLIGRPSTITCKASSTTKITVFSSTRLFHQTTFATRTTTTSCQLSQTPNRHSNQQFTLIGSPISATGSKPETVEQVKSVCFQVRRTLNSNSFWSRTLRSIAGNSSTTIHLRTSSLNLITHGAMSRLIWLNNQKSITRLWAPLLSSLVDSKTRPLKAPKSKMKHALRKTWLWSLLSPRKNRSRSPCGPTFKLSWRSTGSHLNSSVTKVNHTESSKTLLTLFTLTPKITTWSPRSTKTTSLSKRPKLWFSRPMRPLCLTCTHLKSKTC